MQSPLRYPGGKSDFALTAFEIISQCGLKGYSLVEPYAGSAAVSLALLSAEVVPDITLVERDPLVYSLWRAITSHTNELLERFLDLPITIDTWHQLRPLLEEDVPTKKNIVDLALAGLFFNRSNFSGILNAGPIGGLKQESVYTIDCRTNKDDIVCRILTIAAFSDRIKVKHGDAIDCIDSYKNNSKVLFYIDPPYFDKGELLYRHSYRLGDHKRLSRALAEVKFPWFLSYDLHHVIEFLYEKFFVKKVKFQYSARSPKNHEELLISNFEIPFEPVVTRLQRS